MDDTFATDTDHKQDIERSGTGWGYMILVCWPSHRGSQSGKKAILLQQRQVRLGDILDGTTSANSD